MTSLIHTLMRIFCAGNQSLRPQISPKNTPSATVTAASQVEGVFIRHHSKTVPADCNVPTGLRHLLNGYEEEVYPGQVYYHINVAFVDERPAENYFVAPSNNRSGMYLFGGFCPLVAVRATTFDGASVNIPENSQEPWLFLYFSCQNGSSCHGKALAQIRDCKTAI